jgi:hypothetical protein
MMRLAIAALALVAALGCVSNRLEMGAKPPVERIARDLQVGTSTAADVRRVLGEPNGRGAAMLPIHSGPRTVWSYYYEYSDFSGTEAQRGGRTFVWVYLDGDVYDGYLWYSSALDSHVAP